MGRGAPLRSCLSGDSEREEVVVDAASRRGKALQCKVTCMALARDGDGGISGVIMLMEPFAEPVSP